MDKDLFAFEYISFRISDNSFWKLIACLCKHKSELMRSNMCAQMLLGVTGHFGKPFDGQILYFSYNLAIDSWTLHACSVAKNSPTNTGDVGLIPGLGRSPEKGNGNLLQYSCLGNPMDRGAWQATVHGVTKSQT